MRSEITTKLSVLQISLLVILSRFAATFTYLVNVGAPPANQDVWITEILGIVYGVIIYVPLLFLANRFPNMNYLEYVELVMGKLLGKFFGLVIAAGMMFISTVQLPELDIFLRSTLLPETPHAAIVAFMLPVCVYAVYKGLESLGRLAEILAPLILGSVILFTVLDIGKMDFEVLLPVLTESKPHDIHIGAFNLAIRLIEPVALFMLVPHINKKGKITWIFVYYMVGILSFLLVVTISVQTVLGVELAAKANFPYFLHTQTIEMYDVIQRIESLNVLTWILCVILKCSLFVYLAAAGIAQVFGKSYKVFIVPLALFQFVAAVKFPWVKYDVIAKILTYKVLGPINLVSMLFIPLVVLIVYFFRRKSLRGYS